MLRKLCLSNIIIMAFVIASVINAQSTCRAEDGSPVKALPSQLSLTTERVIVFKDGYCLVVKNGTATTNENGIVFTDEVPDSAILGSFWVTASKGELESTVAGWHEETQESQKELDCTNIPEILNANIGKHCNFVSDRVAKRGTILKVLGTNQAAIVQETHFQEILRSDSLSSLAHLPSRFNASLFVLKTGDGEEVINTSTVKDLSIEGMNLKWKKQLATKTKQKRLRMNFAEPNSDVKLTMVYFRPDVRWIPTYKVQLTDQQVKPAAAKKPAGQKLAHLTLQGEILNEAEDFNDVPFHVVVGVPNFRFKDVPSPMTLEATLRRALANAAPDIMNNRSQMMNSMYGQRVSDFHSNRSTGQTPAADVALPKELTSSSGHDLFVYQLKKMTLKKGERATVPILKSEVAYRDVYTWKAHVLHAQAGPEQSDQDASPLVLGAQRVWRQVEMINDTKYPWTTGAAMFVDGFQPLAQELLTYTSPGGICRVPVTVSVDLRAKVTDGETAREANKIKWRGYHYAKVAGKIEAELANNKETAVNVEVQLTFGGRTDRISDDGNKTHFPFRGEDWTSSGYFEVNNSSTVKWKTQIQPGECFKPTIDYHYFLRH